MKQLINQNTKTMKRLTKNEAIEAHKNGVTIFMQANRLAVDDKNIRAIVVKPQQSFNDSKLLCEIFNCGGGNGGWVRYYVKE